MVRAGRGCAFSSFALVPSLDATQCQGPFRAALVLTIPLSFAIVHRLPLLLSVLLVFYGGLVYLLFALQRVVGHLAQQARTLSK